MNSHNEQQKIPQSLNECMRADTTSIDLWNWADRVNSLGQVLLFITIIVGIIVSISSGLEIEKEYTSFYDSSYKNDISFNFIPIIISLVIWTLITLAEYIIYHIFVLALYSLASIAHNTKVTANVALYSAKKNNEDTKTFDNNNKTEENSKVNKETENYNDGWICSKCGNTNPKKAIRCRFCEH